jgi:transposase
MTLAFMVSRKTVFNWFQAWEQHKLIGRYNEPGRGRKPLFSLEQQAQIREWVKAEPRNLKKVLARIEETWDISASRETIKRVLKSVGMSWRRIRKRVAGVPDAVEYATQVAALAVLKELDAAGEIDLRYADATY